MPTLERQVSSENASLKIIEAAYAAVERNQLSAPAWQALALALWQSGLNDEAETAAKHALQLESRLEQARVVLGCIYGRRLKHKEAALEFGRVVKDHPKSFDGWQNLAVTMSALQDQSRAEECYRRALDLKPSNVKARLELANVLDVTARPEEARKELARAARDGKTSRFEIRRAQIFSAIPESAEQILRERQRFAEEVASVRSRVTAVDRFMDGEIAMNFWLAYHGLDDRPLQEKWAELIMAACPNLTGNYAKKRSNPDRLRVGFISSFLKNGHTIGKLNMGLMGQLPRDRFEVIALDVANAPIPSYLPQFSDKVVHLSVDPFQAQQQIADLELDIAHFTDVGMSPPAWQVGLARLAPVQTTSWGHPVTTGIPHFDYFFSSELIEPEGAEAHYSEKLVKLSRLPTFYYRTGRTSRERPSFPEDWRIYLCAQTLFKLHPDFDRVFAEILRRDPAGRLVFIDMQGDFSNRVGDRIKAHYPDIIDRVVFLDRMSMDKFMGLQDACHVMLDTWPFSGGNTNYEAFAMGTPVVTLPADYMRGRVTMGQYLQMGFTDLIASSEEDYIEKALRVANDDEYRMHVRHTIYHAARTHLYEDPTAPKEMADFFERAWKEADAA